jgi:hypothetical protein
LQKNNRPKKWRTIRAGSGLPNAGLGQAHALHCRLGLFAGLSAYLVKLGLGFLLNKPKIQARGLCPKPKPRPARAWALRQTQARSGSGLGPLRP